MMSKRRPEEIQEAITKMDPDVREALIVASKTWANQMALLSFQHCLYEFSGMVPTVEICNHFLEFMDAVSQKLYLEASFSAGMREGEFGELDKELDDIFNEISEDKKED